MAFLEALKGDNTGPLPVWWMRQAGRYLPEYRALKQKHSFWTMSHIPELVHQITMQPLQRYPLDAAILFSDILTPLEYMGVPFAFTEQGPKCQSSGDIPSQIKDLHPEKDMSFVGESITRLKQDLKVPLIGFIGAPFTLASYLIEGGGSKDFHQTRRVFWSSPLKFQKFLDILTESLRNYVQYQIQSGVQAIQIFDSWGGVLGANEYKKWVVPSLQRLIEGLSVPVIFYVQPTGTLLPAIAELGINCLSCDWRMPIYEVADTLKSLGRSDISLQGNLDPLIFTLDDKRVEPFVLELLGGITKFDLRRKCIVNTGHGLIPTTNIKCGGKSGGIGA